jgi:hypothetical protein
MVIEHMVMTGVGASIGSVPPHPTHNCVRNITFRNVTMPGTTKGIYVKSVSEHFLFPDTPLCKDTHCVCMATHLTGRGVWKRSRQNPTCRPGATAEITNILYEGIRIIQPSWWAVWIGPQQQHEPKSALGLKCALDWPITNQCPTQGCVGFTNITLRDVAVEQPALGSPGACVRAARIRFAHALTLRCVCRAPLDLSRRHPRQQQRAQHAGHPV